MLNCRWAVIRGLNRSHKPGAGDKLGLGDIWTFARMLWEYYKAESCGVIPGQILHYTFRDNNGAQLQHGKQLSSKVILFEESLRFSFLRRITQHWPLFIKLVAISKHKTRHFWVSLRTQLLCELRFNGSAWIWDAEHTISTDYSEKAIVHGICKQVQFSSVRHYWLFVQSSTRKQQGDFLSIPLKIQAF